MTNATPATRHRPSQRSPKRQCAQSRRVRARRYEYAPYGERTVYISPGANDPDCHAPTLLPQRVKVGGTAQPYAINDTGFQGKQHDDATGLILQGRRYLHPRFGRLINRDLLHYPDGQNAYAAYFIMHGLFDPTGLDSTPGHGRAFGMGAAAQTLAKVNGDAIGARQITRRLNENIGIGLLAAGEGAASVLPRSFYMDPATLSAEDLECHCRKLRQALARAEMSANVYDQGHPVPAGWERLSADQLNAKGLNPGLFANPRTGLASALYHNSATGEHVLAFRGTDEGKDWTRGNITQAVGIIAGQYQEARDLAIDVQKVTGNATAYTGHSLGGGLATYSSLYVGGSATVFNPAGVSVLNRPFGSGFFNDVSLYHVRGEPLTTIQDYGSFSVLRAIGDRTALAGISPLYNSFARHSIDEVIQSLRNRIAKECP